MLDALQANEAKQLGSQLAEWRKNNHAPTPIPLEKFLFGQHGFVSTSRI